MEAASDRNAHFFNNIEDHMRADTLTPVTGPEVVASSAPQGLVDKPFNGLRDCVEIAVGLIRVPFLGAICPDLTQISFGRPLEYSASHPTRLARMLNLKAAKSNSRPAPLFSASINF